MLGLQHTIDSHQPHMIMNPRTDFTDDGVLPGSPNPFKRQFSGSDDFLLNGSKRARLNEPAQILRELSNNLSRHIPVQSISVFKTITPLKNAKYYKETANIVQACSIKEGLALYVKIPGDTSPSPDPNDYVATLCFADERHTEVPCTGSDGLPAVQVCHVKTDSRNLPQDSVELKIRVNQKTCDVDSNMRKFHFCVRIQPRTGRYSPDFSEPFISVPKVTRPMKKSQNDESGDDEEHHHQKQTTPTTTTRAATSPALQSAPANKFEDLPRREIHILHNNEGTLTVCFQGKCFKFRCEATCSLDDFKKNVNARLTKYCNIEWAAADEIPIVYADEQNYPVTICDTEQLSIALEDLATISRKKGTNSRSNSSGQSSAGNPFPSTTISREQF